MFRKTLRWIFKEDFDQEIQTQMIVMRQLKNERDSYVDQNMELCNRMCDMKRELRTVRDENLNFKSRARDAIDSLSMIL